VRRNILLLHCIWKIDVTLWSYAIMEQLVVDEKFQKLLRRFIVLAGCMMIS
jgi:hypothetical protein